MSGHVKFPELTPEARAAFDRGYEAIGLSVSAPGERDRLSFAAFLVEAMKQAKGRPHGGSAWQELAAIAANLHSPPPPPPTLDQARAADLHTAEGKATVSAFLALLGEGVQQ
jgi:hypothetical protein